MQTTLLGLSIAIILALVAALVGPYFVDWTAYRAAFEARASRLVGMPVHITGPIEARLLPTPWLTLHAVEGSEPTGEPRFKVRQVGIELALGSLLRGEWRASEIHVIAPQIGLGLDAEGRIDWTGTAAGIDPEALTIERLRIEQGRVTLADKASASWMSLDKLSFNGELRSLVGPFKGDGTFQLRGVPHAYKLSAGRKAHDGSMRMRLTVDSAENPFSADIDGLLQFDGGAPRFEGSLVLAQQPSVALEAGRAVNSLPWRVSSRLRLAAASAAFEQLELLYGTEDRAVKLGGTAELRFGEHPRLDATLSARQLDLDRFAGLPEGAPRLPLVVLRAIADTVGGSIDPPLPVRLALSVEQLTLADGVVQGLRGDVAADASGWTIEALEFRAPGFANVRAGGRVVADARAATFIGPVTLEATDPKVLAAWLEGRITATSGTIGPLRASGQLTLASDRLALEQLRAEVDGKAVTGRLAYAWVTETQRPRLEAEVKAADLDVDGVVALIKTALPDASFDAPAEVALSLDLGRALVAGVEARGVQARLKLDPSGLAVERLTVAGLAGAAVELSGRVQAPWAAPRGSLTLDLSGNRLDGVTALLHQFVPTLAEPLRAMAPQLAPAKLRASIGFEPLASTGPAATTARLRVDGTAGPFRLAFSAESTGEAADWRQAATHAEARIEVAEGAALARLLALDGVVVFSPGPATLRWTASGPAGGELTVQARLAAVGADVIASGVLRLAGESGPNGSADVSVTVLDAPALRPLTGRRNEPAPTALKAALTLSHERLIADQLVGTIGDSALNGRLVLTFGAPPRLEGRLDADSVDAAAVLGAFAGMPAAPARVAADAPVWPAAPFGRRLLQGVTGEIELTATRALLTAALDIRRLRAALRLKEQEISIDEVQGTLAGGRLQARVGLQNSVEGTAAVVRIGLTGAELAAFAPAGSPPVGGGRFNLQLDLKGAGRTPAAMAGTLGGGGTISFERLALAGLDPQTFSRVVRVADEETGIDPARVKTLVERAIDLGRLRIAQAEGTLSVVAGQLRLATMLARGEGADLAVTGSIDLVKLLVDGRLTLQGTSGEGGPFGRPEIDVTLKGPVAAPRRTIDVSTLVGWLTLRSVEQQAKRLEEAERRAAEAAAAARAAPRPVPSPPLPAPQQPATGTAVPEPLIAPAPPPPAVPHPGPATAGPRSPTAATPAPAAPAADPAPAMAPPTSIIPGRANAPQPAPSAGAAQAPALPPPIEVQPAPGSRQNGARPQRSGPSAGPRPSELPPPPAAGRTIFDLFRW